MIEQKNRFTRWEPINEVPEEMFIEAILDDYEGFRIILRGKQPDSRTLRIKFDDKVAYRNTDEAYLSRWWTSFPSGSLIGNLFIVENSTYADDFERISEGLHPSGWQLVHYAIYTVHDCIDVLSPYEPVIEWLN